MLIHATSLQNLGAGGRTYLQNTEFFPNLMEIIFAKIQYLGGVFSAYDATNLQKPGGEDIFTKNGILQNVMGSSASKNFVETGRGETFCKI